MKHSTFNKYESVISNHINPFFDDYTINQINDEHILSFFNSLIIKFLLNLSIFICKKYEVGCCYINLMMIDKVVKEVVTLSAE